MTDEPPEDFGDRQAALVRLFEAVMYGTVEARETLSADAFIVMGVNTGDGTLSFSGMFPDAATALAHAERVEQEVAEDAEPGESPYQCRVFPLYAP